MLATFIFSFVGYHLLNKEPKPTHTIVSKTDTIVKTVYQSPSKNKPCCY